MSLVRSLVADSENRRTLRSVNMRYFFEVRYHGAPFHGWQSQQNALGVQEVLEQALSKLLREDVRIVGSGRTDTGVHCSQQFFHADLQNAVDTEDLIHKLNSFLSKDIAIRSIQAVRPESNARFDAIEREYEYLITRRKDPLKTGLAYYYFRPLDVSLMNEAAGLLVGKHDFQSFSKVKTDVQHFLCEIYRAEWNQKGDLLVFHIAANRFLRGMVRAIVGTLIDVGAGKTSLAEWKKIIQGRDRRRAGMNAPAEGLYLVRVKYPAGVFLKKGQHG